MPSAHETAADAAPGRSSAYAIYILLLMLLVNTISYADRHLFSILIPAIKAEFGASDSLMGLIGGPGFMISFVLFTIPVARL
ncbi:MAG TPA: MFS transporter, partial [Pedomonas sp.]